MKRLLGLLLLILPAQSWALTNNQCAEICPAWPGGTCTGDRIEIVLQNDRADGAGPSSSTIAFNFDKDYEFGCFANSFDVWVRDPGSGVTVSSMEPAQESKRHGASVDFASTAAAYGRDDGSIGLNQPFDGVLEETFSQKQRVQGQSVPLNATQRPVSLTKMRSLPSPQRAALHVDTEFAYVLTAVPSVPANNGLTVFRPPWSGSEKPMYSTTDIQWDLIPNLSSAGIERDGSGGVQSNKAKFLRWCRTPSIDAQSKDNFTYVVPILNGHGYGTDNINKYVACPLTTFLDFWDEGGQTLTDAERDLVIASIQQGIDLFYTLKTGRGTGWAASAGFSASRMLPVAFAAAVLEGNDIRPAMMNRFDTAIGGYHNPGNEFSEDGHLYVGQNGAVLWGEALKDDPWAPGPSFYSYDPSEYPGGGSRTVRDPSGRVDGGPNPGGDYQGCCSTGAYVAAATAAYMLPEVAVVIQANGNRGKKFFDYVERWQLFGAWAPGHSAHGTGNDQTFHGLGFANDLYAKHASCLRTTTKNAAGQDALDQILASCPGQTDGTSRPSPPLLLPLVTE
jgi:hypothetical protein